MLVHSNTTSLYFPLRQRAKESAVSVYFPLSILCLIYQIKIKNLWAMFQSFSANSHEENPIEKKSRAIFTNVKPREGRSVHCISVFLAPWHFCQRKWNRLGVEVYNLAIYL